MNQLDALRKALGLAPGVDPIESCRALGAKMEPSQLGEGPGNHSTSESAESSNGKGNEN